MGITKGRIPLWITNIVVFGLLISVVLLYFFWQTTQAKKAFLDHAREHAQLVAGVIKLNARSAVFSQEVTEEILRTFLANTARFVDYLNTIEPFAAEELTAFAKETNLAGIRIYESSGSFVEGPSGWLHGQPFVGSIGTRLEHRPSEHLYLFCGPRQSGAGYILVGLTATSVETLQEQLGLGRLTETLEGLPAICYAVLEAAPAGTALQADEPVIYLLETADVQAAEFRLYMGDQQIVVGMCTDYLVVTLNRIWRDFLVFGTALALLGALLSFVLYRQQSGHLAKVRTYERQISRQREDAALGRAAASIAHEIRNPLNAIKMGLQRLQLEGRDIDEEHKRVVELMLDEVRRTNGIVSGLLNYARPRKPNLQTVRFDELVKDVLDLYLPRCTAQGLQVTHTLDFHEPITADPDLLHQVVENIIKNAIEAQPEGGFIAAELEGRSGEACLKITNGGFSLSPDETSRIFDPYFTCKAEGTGLGLSIAQRIIQSHKGRMGARSPRQGTFEITVFLPVQRGAAGDTPQTAGKEPS